MNSVLGKFEDDSEAVSMADEILPMLVGSDEEIAATEPESSSPRLERVLADIAEAERLCASAEADVDEAKAVLKEAKAEYDRCVLDLRRLAKAVRNDEDRPLFANLNDDAEEDGDYTRSLAESIRVLGLSDGIVSKFTEAGVNTVGDLEHLRGEIILGRAEWPKGIGPAKIDLIETVVSEWLADNCKDGTAEPDEDDSDE